MQDQDREREIAGATARAFVSGGLDPSTHPETGRDYVVKRLLQTPCWTFAERAEVAVSLIEGWMSSHPGDAEPLVWHRLFGDTVIQVNAS